jgi:hypothetical protein
MPTTPGYAECSLPLRHSLVTRTAYLTWAVKPTSLTATAIAAAVESAVFVSSSLSSVIDSNVLIGPVTVKLGVDGAEDQVAVGGSSYNGTLAGGSPTPNVATLVIKHTSRGGRRGKGRLFIPWCVSTSNMDEAGHIDNASISFVNTRMATFLSTLTSNVVPMYLTHSQSTKPNGTEPHDSGGPPNLVTSLTCDATVATQRRRLGR